MRFILISAISIFIATTVYAAESHFINSGYKKLSTNQYLVSAVLRKNDEAATIKLIQSIENAISREEAMGLVTNKVAHDFLGYSILDILVKPVPIAECENINWV